MRRAVDFEADGTFATPEGIAGRWSMEGDRITLDEDDATTTVRVLAVDEGHDRAQDGGRLVAPLDALPERRRRGRAGTEGRVTATGAAAALLLFAAAPPASPQPPSSAHPAATPLSAAGLVGRWGDNGDCTHFLIFRGDGTFRSYTGGEGSWSLTGGRLVMTGASGSQTRLVSRIDAGRIRIVNPGGSAGVSQRCPSPAG